MAFLKKKKKLGGEKRVNSKSLFPQLIGCPHEGSTEPHLQITMAILQSMRGVHHFGRNASIGSDV
jgi:hypothetical protein